MARSKTRSMGDARGLSWPAIVVANLLVLAVLGWGAYLHSTSPERYYASLQEDAYLEWATVWAFLLGAAVFVAAALAQRRRRGGLPWFLAGAALFCFVVGMEEISWGQRLLGYRPPAYFLEHNFQQELNVHNVFSTALRKLALKWSIGGYGVLLPLVALVPAVRRLFERLRVVSPPLALAPAFAAAFFLYQNYPWKFTGELVELMLGLGLLFAALDGWRRHGSEKAGRAAGLWPVAAAWGLVLLLGVATAAASNRLAGDDPARLEEARREAEHLKLDFLGMARRGGGPGTRCGLHKRVFSYVEKYGAKPLYEGRFAALTSQGMPEERAAFFLDPWNSPYWIRDRCSESRDRRVVFVYSFGPNRRRDSTPWEIQGDDVGAVIYSGRP